jgi:propanediol dehydratase small subunit
MIFHRDQYLRPRRRNYTERELKQMADELRRIAPASRVARLFRRKGERP